MFEAPLKQRLWNPLPDLSLRITAFCTAASNKGASSHMGTKSSYCHRSDLSKLSPGGESILSPVRWKQMRLLSHKWTQRKSPLFLSFSFFLHILCITPFSFLLDLGCLPSDNFHQTSCAPTKRPPLGRALGTPMRIGLNFGFLELNVRSGREEGCYRSTNPFTITLRLTMIFIVQSRNWVSREATNILKNTHW